MTIQQAGGGTMRDARELETGQGSALSDGGPSGLASLAGGDPLSIGLGLFSLGLGMAELTAPAGFAKLIGMPSDPDHHAVLQGAGLREVASGIGILSQRRPAASLWSRVAGDVMDLMLLAGAARSPRSNRTRLAVAAGAVLGVTVLDVVASQMHAEAGAQPLRPRQLLKARQQRMGARLGAGRAAGVPRSAGIHVTTSITLNKSRSEVYRFWRQFENLPTFMSHLESVQTLSERKSRWVAKAPAGQHVSWEAELIEDRPDELLRWRSSPGALVPNEGTVRFVDAAGKRGTELHVDLRYQPPGGALAAFFAKLFGEEPSQQVRSDLRRFKQVMETGEVLHSDASVHRGAHPAQPSEKTLRHQGMLLGSQLKGATS